MNKAESGVFKLWMLYFQRIPYSDYLEIARTVVVRVAAVKRLPVHRHSDVIFIFSGPLGL